MQATSKPGFIENNGAKNGLDSQAAFYGTLFYSFFILMLVWLAVFLEGDDAISQLFETSSGFSRLELDASAIYSIFFIVSYAVVFFAVVGLIKYPAASIVLCSLTLSLTEVDQPVIHGIALGLRYVEMVVFSGLGLWTIASNRWASFIKVQYASIAILFWQLVLAVYHGIDFEAVMRLFSQIFFFIGIIFGFSYLIKSVDALRSAIIAIAIGALFLTGFQLLSFVAAPHYLVAGRFAGWSPLPTNFAGSFVMFAITLLWVVFNRTKISAKWLHLIACIAAVGLIVLSGTRSAVLSITATLLLFIFLWRREWISPGIFVFAISTVIAFIAMQGSDSGDQATQRLGSVVDASSLERVAIWQVSAGLIKQNPFWGYGLGEGIFVSGNLFKTMDYGNIKLLMNTHNSLIGLGLRQGIVGLSAHIAYTLLVLLQVIGLIKKYNKNDSVLSCLLWILALMAAEVLRGLFEETLNSRGTLDQFMFAITGAATVALTGKRIISS